MSNSQQGVEHISRLVNAHPEGIAREEMLRSLCSKGLTEDRADAAIKDAIRQCLVYADGNNLHSTKHSSPTRIRELARRVYG